MILLTRSYKGSIIISVSRAGNQIPAQPPQQRESQDMAPKVKTRKTANQRREQAEALQTQITEQVEALRDSGAWQQFLDFAQNFHSYSLNNLLLILSQNRNASAVTGFRKWQELNRQVRKGEKALKILGYGEKKMTAEPDAHRLPITRNGKVAAVKFYLPMPCVFDSAQTDLTDREAGDPSTLAQQLPGEDTAGIAAAVAHCLPATGWTVTTEHITTGAN